MSDRRRASPRETITLNVTVYNSGDAIERSNNFFLLTMMLLKRDETISLAFLSFLWLRSNNFVLLTTTDNDASKIMLLKHDATRVLTSLQSEA